MKHLLIACDDAHTAAWVANALTGLDATLERCGAGEVREAVTSGSAELVVIDAGRNPGLHTSAIEELAAGGRELKLLLLIEAEALEGLRLPVRVPADFVVRGASSSEVLTRARGLLWPGEEVASQEVVRLDDLTLNLATYQAYVRDEPVEFTYLEYALFAFLVTHPNRVYSREVLLKRVWDTDYFGGARTVDVHVRRVRSKLGPELARRLETVRNVGYLWKS